MPPFTPDAQPDAIVQDGQVRFTVLTSRLIRLEWQAHGRFTDAPSQAIWHRHQPVPPFAIDRSDDTLTLTTDHLTLTYTGGPFTADSLIINHQSFTYRYGDTDPYNLLGTTRTLDGISGDTKLDPGLISPSGWAVVDDSRSLIFTEDGWLTPRPDDAGLDLYFFGYGRSYRDTLRDFAKIAGPVPMIPRYAFGNWWSRYWAYSQDELAELMRAFRAHDVPLSVCIVDMDWHLDGWTGYTWNRDLFPDPDGFINWLHEQGLRTALNLHPADGVGPHEAQYAAMARRLGVDPATQQPIPFDIANPDFARAYFEELHHPEEDRGVDFWWIDWQQGEISGLPGLDPLWWLNHLHYADMARDKASGDAQRPFIFSRWGGLGNHRYPIGFSGDTYVNWETLAFQPYFTATAANVQYGWWSHDIGGHQRGIEDGELYARWVQFGVFSPIMRLHSSKSAYHERRPWGYDAAVDEAASAAMRLRHRLIPYLYTLNWQHHKTAVPPIRPLYHDHPEREEAYACPQQYTFGDDLIAAPFTAPADADTRLSRQVAWLPPGDWTHFFTGEALAGDSWHAIYGHLADIPVFARAGAIVPLGPEVGWGGVDNPAELHLKIFAGADGSFTLYEDDGETQAYLDNDYTQTVIHQQWRGDGVTVTIDPARGETGHLPLGRTIILHIFGISDATAIDGPVSGIPLTTSYDAGRECLTVGPLPLDPATGLHLDVAASLSRRDRTRENVNNMLRAFRLETAVKTALGDYLDHFLANPDWLQQYAVTLRPSQTRALLEVTQQAGVHHLRAQRHPHQIILWNNHDNPDFRYRYAGWQPDEWDHKRQFAGETAVVPRFKTIIPERPQWWLTMDFRGLIVSRIKS